MTALNLLGVYSVALIIVWVMLSIENGKGTEEIMTMIGAGIVFSSISFGVGILFVCIMKLLMSYLGVIFINDIAYVVIYFFLSVFICGRKLGNRNQGVGMSG